MGWSGHPSGDQDRIGFGYRWRRINAEQADAIVAARAAGVSAADLAKEYGVTPRSIYRAVEMAGLRRVVVAVDGWRAQFVVGPEGPVRVSAWHSDPGAPA